MVPAAYNSRYQERLSRVRGAANRLQSLNLLSGKETDDLPGIVVVGNQNVGKSALLEAISGVRLPSAANCCTRCPLMLEMHRSDSAVMTVSYELNGAKRKVDLTRLEDVTQAILNATKELTGNQETIVNAMISVKVMTPTSPNLTLIDLPGLLGTHEAGMTKDTPAAIVKMVNKYIKGDNRIICFLMIAGTDAGAQAQGLDITRGERRDKSGVRTVGVLTKVDLPGDGSTRDNIMNTTKKFPLVNGYYAVRCRKKDEFDLTDAEIRQVEAEFFRNNPDFGASPPCYTGVPALVAKLEDLQWNVYKRVLPCLRLQISRELSKCTKERATLGDTLENAEEARRKVQDLLGSVLYYARSAMSTGFVEINEQKLINVLTLKHYHRRFEAMTQNFIGQVHAGPSGVQGKGLLGVLWSESTTAIFEELIGDLTGAVLKNVQSHPKHVGRVFEEVVHPILQGPAEGLVDELQVSVTSVFQVVIAHVYAEWPQLQPVIMEQVQILLNEQAQHAKNYIGETIKMMSDYQNTFVGQYERTCSALIDDANTIKALLANPATKALDGNLVFTAEPWMMVLSSAVPIPGALMELLSNLVRSRSPMSPTDVNVSQALELQIKLIVFSQITLQRFFDEVPIAARAFLVHKVVKLLEGRWLANKLDDPSCVQAMWAAMQAGQEENINRKQDLDFKITELRACLSALSDPDLSFDMGSAASTPAPSPPPEPVASIDVERHVVANA